MGFELGLRLGLGLGFEPTAAPVVVARDGEARGGVPTTAPG